MEDQIIFKSNLVESLVAPKYVFLSVSDISKYVEISQCLFSSCNVRLISSVSAANSVTCKSDCYENNEVKEGSFSINPRYQDGVLFGTINQTIEFNTYCECSASSGARQSFILNECNFTKICARSNQYRSGYCISATSEKNCINYLCVERCSGPYFFAIHYIESDILISNFVACNNSVDLGWVQYEGVTDTLILKFEYSMFKDIHGSGTTIINKLGITFFKCGAENNNQNFEGQLTYVNMEICTKDSLCNFNKITRCFNFIERKSLSLVFSFMLHVSEFVYYYFIMFISNPFLIFAKLHLKNMHYIYKFLLERNVFILKQ